MPTFQTSTGPVSITASTTKTILQLATASTVPVLINKWWVGSDATSAGTATSALRVQIGRFSGAVTTASGASTGGFDAAGFVGSAVSTVSFNTTTEGSGAPSGEVEDHLLGLTQSELIVWEPMPVYIPVSSWWRVRVIVPAGIGTTNLYAGVQWTE